MKTPSFTAEMAAKAKTMVLTMGMKQHQAAALLGVNQGRVNEALRHPKWANVAPAPVSEVRI